MGIVKPTKAFTFVNGPGSTADGTEVNENFDRLYSKVGEVIDALNNASGTKANLDTRLDVALNDDGTPRTGVTAGGEWINPALTTTYVSSTQFTCSGGNHTDIYLTGRRLKIGLAASTVYSEVVTSSYSGGITTITILDDVLTNPLTSIEHGHHKPYSSGQSSLPNTPLLTKVISDWQWIMYEDGTCAVNHGLDGSKIQAVSVTIDSDDGLTHTPLTANNQGSFAWGAVDIQMSRVGGGYFDSSDYSGTGNRGKIVIWYEN
jgi:hypothetical protein